MIFDDVNRYVDRTLNEKLVYFPKPVKEDQEQGESSEEEESLSEEVERGGRSKKSSEKREEHLGFEPRGDREEELVQEKQVRRTRRSGGELW